MATTSSSPRGAGRRAHWTLRLADVRDGTQVDFPLLAAYVPASLDLAPEGVVHEAHAYEAYVLTDAGACGCEAVWSVNGESAVAVTLRDAGPAVSGAGGSDDGRRLLWLEPALGGAWVPFAQTYGFAHVELELASGEVLATRDIACACDRADQKSAVVAMMEELRAGEDREAIGWMLAEPGEPASRGVGLALPGSSPSDGASLSTFLALAEVVLRRLERNLGFLRAHAFRRTTKESVAVEPGQVRRLGRRELQWLAANPDVLRRVDAETPVRAGGACYLPERVQTERPQTTCDVPENRSVLAFARAVASSLAGAYAEAKDQVEGLERTRERLRGLGGEDTTLPSLVIMDACLECERPLVERARALLSRARDVTHALTRAMPQVRRQPWRLPRRTKPFQEIPVYADVYDLMRRWDAFGEFSMRRDGLLLHTWRMDKLYEYYVLYRLLSALRGRGFALAAEPGTSAIRASYSLADRDYENERQVATVYRLVRADERLTLFYQPVFYADEREENDVRLHRTSAGSRHPYWTPDYLLVREAGGARTTAVLDAKFRRPTDVRRYESVSVGEGMDVQTESTLRECLRKYKLETAGPDGRGVDAVWLLCGRAGERSVWRLQASAWARAQGRLACDGVVTVAPGADALDEVLRDLGIAEDEGE